MTENDFRRILKTLNESELQYSHLYGFDLDNEPADILINQVVNLYGDVESLKSLLLKNGDYKSKRMKRIITEEYNRKKEVLIKLMNENYIYLHLMRKIIDERQDEYNVSYQRI
jgi:hypothetical protein